MRTPAEQISTTSRTSPDRRGPPSGGLSPTPGPDHRHNVGHRLHREPFFPRWIERL